MKSKLSNAFLINYLIVFLLSLLAGICAVFLLSFSNDVIAKTLMKNNYPASALMRDDYADIDASPVVENGGGVQVVDAQYRVVSSAGLDIMEKKQFTVGEWTEFLVQSRSKGIAYHIDVQYNQNEHFWLVVVFPTSIRLDVSLVYNREVASKDMGNVLGVFVAALLFYLLLLALFAVLFSKITAIAITNPLKKLCEGTERLREGDYSARVQLRLKNEFAQLQDTFNGMAEKIQQEIALRKQSEEDRKRMISDISHDLQNPLASVIGYAELCLDKGAALDDAQRGYLELIYKNSQRASRLIKELFELSKVENPAFTLKLQAVDACEYMRQVCAELLPALERAGFGYTFDIPDEAAFARIDPGQMSRVFHNLADNAVRYNPPGTMILVALRVEPAQLHITFADNGIGIPCGVAEDMFKPFARADDARNSQTGGSGLGLSIAQKIVQAHGGSIALHTDAGQGCAFHISLPAN